MTKLIRFMLTLGLLLLLPARAKPAPGQDLEDGWQVYTNANDVWDLALEGGYTWAATEGGVVCYSASEQVKFTTADGLAHNYVRAIIKDSRGWFWSGTMNGVSILDDGGTPFDKGDDTWTTFTESDGLADNSVRAIAEDGGGRLWFGTGEGVSVLDNGGTLFDKEDDTWNTFTESDGLAGYSVGAIVEDDGGRLWFGTYSGVSVLDDGGTPFDKGDDVWATFTTADGLADYHIYDITVDGGGRLWFGTFDGASVLDDGGTPFNKGDDIWTTFTKSDGLVYNGVEDIAVDGGGLLWFVTHSGVSVLDDGGTPFNKGDDAWISFTSADGLAQGWVEAIVEGGGGRWWFGTRFGGVSVLDDGGTPFNKGDDIWSTFTESDGLVHNGVEDIAEDGGGRFWFGTQDGVSVLDDSDTPFDKGDDTWITFTTADGLADNWVEIITKDGGGRWWFGNWFSGVNVLDDGGTPFDKGDDAWTTFTTADGLANNYVYAITVDGGGLLWFGTYGGVSVLDDGGTSFDKGDDTWITFATADGLADSEVRAIAEDGGGRWWFGTWSGGVSALDDGDTPFDKGDDTWVTFTTLDGLTHNSVIAIAVDGGGRWWFGTWSGGVSVLDDGGTPFDKGDDTWTSFTTADGLADNSVRPIVEDGRGRLWFGTGGYGVSVLDDGGTPFEKGDDTWTTFTTAEGLADNFVYAIAEDSGGRLWFGTGYGVGELVDAVAPTSNASSPTYANGAFPVSWSASDEASGVFSTTLWVKYGSGGTWTETGLSQRGEISGTFTYTPTQGDGIYYFATVAEDWMGNTQATPTGSGDTSTVYGTIDSGDAYEPDDTCTQASSIPNDGTIQEHTFHQHADEDWAGFTVVSNTVYVLQATSTSTGADLVLELYDACDGNLEGSDDNAFGADARIIFTASASDTYYVRALNHDPTTYGPDVTYALSVRAQIPGAAVIVAGHNDAWSLQGNIDHSTNTAYRSFLLAGIPESKLYYLNPNPGLQDPDEDGVYDDMDAVSTAANLQYALETWATSQVEAGEQLFVYLMDHGSVDAFATDGEGDLTTPQMLDTWLHTVEDTTGCIVNVIIEACRAGSFIDQIPDVVQEISEVGRVVIASTGRQQNAYASPEGAHFSDAFWTSIQNSSDLWLAFQDAVAAVEATGLWQTPWLDDNGNATPNDPTDGQVAAGRGLVSFFGSRPPVVDAVTVTLTSETSGLIQAKVRDDYGVQSVWAIVIRPSFQEPPPGQPFEWPDLDLPTLELLESGGLYQRTYNSFGEVGLYRVLVYARDQDGNQAVPVAEQFRTGNTLYLPLIAK
jgi:ligand-binding sensor domain-containing protein